jgi:hypothetical protein
MFQEGGGPPRAARSNGPTVQRSASVSVTGLLLLHRLRCRAGRRHSFRTQGFAARSHPSTLTRGPNLNPRHASRLPASFASLVRTAGDWFLHAPAEQAQRTVRALALLARPDLSAGCLWRLPGRRRRCGAAAGLAYVESTPIMVARVSDGGSAIGVSGMQPVRRRGGVINETADRETVSRAERARCPNNLPNILTNLLPVTGVGGVRPWATGRRCLPRRRVTRCGCRHGGVFLNTYPYSSRPQLMGL